MKFRQNPFPGEPNPNVLCIGGCDNAVLETLNVATASIRRCEYLSALHLLRTQFFIFSN